MKQSERLVKLTLLKNNFFKCDVHNQIIKENLCNLKFQQLTRFTWKNNEKKLGQCQNPNNCLYNNRQIFYCHQILTVHCNQDTTDGGDRHTNKCGTVKSGILTESCGTVQVGHSGSNYQCFLMSINFNKPLGLSLELLVIM